ncbi:ATP-binding protein [Breznakiellaceae bacterium SP9]
MPGKTKKTDLESKVALKEGEMAAAQPESYELGASIVTKKIHLLEHIEKIVKLCGKKGLCEEYFEKANVHIKYVGQKLHLTPIQTILFSHFLNNCDNQTIMPENIAESLKCSNIQIIRYMNEFDELEKKKLVCCCRGNRSVTYRIPFEVITSLRKDEEYKPVDHHNIAATEFFSVIEGLFGQRIENELTFENLCVELHSMIEINMQLRFCQVLKDYDICEKDMILLVYFCLLFVNNNDDHVGFHDLEDLFDDRYMFRNIMDSLSEGYNELLERNFIEYSNNDGFGDRECYKLTDKSKKDLLDELNIKQRLGNPRKDMILAASIADKKMFYHDNERAKIERLQSLLDVNNFKRVQERLKKSGMRIGFACLFSGPPGTGKTETVYQIARQTGRDIMMVDISDTKSMWFGESEKKIKAIFDRYKACLEKSDLEPILLFNEADAIISKRKELSDSNRAVDQTENTIQNIILQEMENLTGILIATSNLTQNMDTAFERRFLYKIEFDKPSIEARQAIWQNFIPTLAGAETKELAALYNFSGGQIENIARKRTIESVISEEEPSLELLKIFCDEELFARKDAGKKMGFGLSA